MNEMVRMPVLTEKPVVRSKSTYYTPLLTVPPQKENKNMKKKKKTKKMKFKKQFVSLTSVTELEKDINRPATKDEQFLQKLTERSVSSISALTMLYQPMTKQPNEISSTSKLPALKSPTPPQVMSNQSCTSQSCTPRVPSGCRLPITLPSNLQPSAHERRKRLPILSAIKPENEKAEKERFMRASYNYNPFFIYRFPADSDTLERHGVPSDKYLNQAKLIMDIAIQRYGTYEKFEEQTGGKYIQRSNIMALILRYLKRENMEREISVNLSEDLLSRGSMTRVKGKPTLNVRVVNLREFWVEGLLRHEIGTHYLRSMNNKYQEWYNWRVRRDLGLKPANPTEEGLASLHSVLFRKDPSLWRAALLYYTAYKAAFLSLKELFRDLGQFVSDPCTRWDYCIRAKRGQSDTSVPGAFCKDQVYLDGALQLLKNRKNIDFHLLVRLGKISYEDIGKLELLGDLEHTRVPFFMEDLTAYHKYLDRICEANGLTDEVLENV